MALELDGPWQPGALGDEAPDGRVDDRAVRVGGHGASSSALGLLAPRAAPCPAGRADAHDAAPGPALVQRLGQGADDAPAGRGQRVAGGERAAVDVELVVVDLAERRVAAEPLAAEDGVGPRLQRAQHCAANASWIS